MFHVKNRRAIDTGTTLEIQEIYDADFSGTAPCTVRMFLEFDGGKGRGFRSPGEHIFSARIGGSFDLPEIPDTDWVRVGFRLELLPGRMSFFHGLPPFVDGIPVEAVNLAVDDAFSAIVARIDDFETLRKEIVGHVRTLGGTVSRRTSTTIAGFVRAMREAASGTGGGSEAFTMLDGPRSMLVGTFPACSATVIFDNLDPEHVDVVLRNDMRESPLVGVSARKGLDAIRRAVAGRWWPLLFDDTGENPDEGPSPS